MNCNNFPNITACKECSFNNYVMLGDSNNYNCFIQRHRRQLRDVASLKDYIYAIIINKVHIRGTDIPYNNIWFAKALELYFNDHYDYYIKLNLLK